MSQIRCINPSHGVSYHVAGSAVAAECQRYRAPSSTPVQDVPAPPSVDETGRRIYRTSSMDSFLDEMAQESALRQQREADLVRLQDPRRMKPDQLDGIARQYVGGPLGTDPDIAYALALRSDTSRDNLDRIIREVDSPDSKGSALYEEVELDAGTAQKIRMAAVAASDDINRRGLGTKYLQVSRQTFEEAADDRELPESIRDEALADLDRVTEVMADRHTGPRTWPSAWSSIRHRLSR